MPDGLLSSGEVRSVHGGLGLPGGQHPLAASPQRRRRHDPGQYGPRPARQHAQNNAKYAKYTRWRFNSPRGPVAVFALLSDQKSFYAIQCAQVLFLNKRKT